MSANMLLPAVTPSDQRAHQEGLVIRGRTGFRIHGIAVRQDDEAHPALNTTASETQLLGNFPDRPAGDVEGSDLIEKSLTVSAEASLRQALRAFRSPSLARAIRPGGGPLSDRRFAIKPNFMSTPSRSRLRPS
jgi:hypothetical protein